MLISGEVEDEIADVLVPMLPSRCGSGMKAE